MRASAACLALLLGCGGGAASVDLSVTAPKPVDLNDFRRGPVILPALHLCAQPKLKLNGVPLSATGTADPAGLVLPSEAVWEVLSETLQDLHPLCDGERVLKLEVDCAGQAPVDGGEPLTTSTTSVDVTFRKTPVTRAYATPGLGEVSPLSFPTLYFESLGVEEATLVNAVTVSGVAGKLEVLEHDDRTEVVFIPNEPLQPGQSYSARLNLGLAGLRTEAGGCIIPDGRDNISWRFDTRGASQAPFQAEVKLSGAGLRLRWDALGAAKFSVYAVASASATTGGTLLTTTREASAYLERTAGSCFRVDAEPHGRAVVSSTVACLP